ncbi:Cysteine proteinase inhibitor 2, partial [Mucuna pruriens]
MAALIRSSAVTLAVVTIFACVAAYEGSVGGRKEIGDVKTNKEVQELGRFAVEEYNIRLMQRRKEEGLTFVEVMEAQKQVVSGIKYYMKIAVTQSGGDSRMFDSVVVVKPWLRSKELLNFAPSTQ